MRDVAELEPLEQCTPAVLPVGEPTQPGRELQVLPRGRARHQAADVGAVARGPPRGERLGAQVVPGDDRDPLGGREHAGQDPHGRRLAGAVAAEQGGRLAGVRRQVDAGHGLDLAEPDAETAHVDDRRRHGPGLLHPVMMQRSRRSCRRDLCEVGRSRGWLCPRG